MSFSVSEAVVSRRSVRAFRPDPVPAALIRSVLEKAQRAPSGGNLQPWHAIVLAGEPLRRFKEGIAPSARKGLGSEPPQYAIYPASLPSPYRDRRLQVGEDMYMRLGIAREDKAGRAAWFANNFTFFGAPLALLVHTPAYMGPPQWADVGMWLQTVMLLLREEGLDSCAQEAWSLFHGSIRKLLPIPDDHILFAGLAIGYADPDEPVNDLRAARAPLDEMVRWSVD